MTESNGLQMAVISQEFLDEIKTELSEGKDILRDKKKNKLNNEWIESSEARQRLPKKENQKDIREHTLRQK